VTPAELGVAGALGVAGLALVGLAAYLVRRRRGPDRHTVGEDAHASRRTRVVADEDPILAALGVSEPTREDRA
jgi:hypothetical protein